MTLAEPPDEFDEYELVILLRGDDPPRLSDEESDHLQRRHLGHLQDLREAGALKVAGPLDEQADDTWRGICVYRVGSLDEAVRLASSDPAVVAGRLTFTAMKWFTAKGALDFPLARGAAAD